MLGVGYCSLPFRIYIQQPGDSLSADNVAGKDLFRILRLNLCVESIVRYYFYDRAFFTETEAACSDNFNLAFKIVLCNKFLEILGDMVAFRSLAACSSAGQDLHFRCSLLETAAYRRVLMVALFTGFEMNTRFFTDFLQILNRRYFHKNR